MALPISCYHPAQIRALEQLAAQQFQLSSAMLMNRAGEAGLSCLRAHWPQAKSLTVLCGPGNNGGDGYVLARLAHEQHMQVKIFYLGEYPPRSEAALAAALATNAREVPLAHISTLQPSDLQADVVVDALLGSGLQDELSPFVLEIIELINSAKSDVFALDCPTGLHMDTGSIAGGAVLAKATLTFLGLKPGFFTAEGPTFTGKLYFDDLGLPGELYRSVHPMAQRLSLKEVQSYLPPRSRTAHKGYYGHVLILGGDLGMGGAACLAAQAAARIGAGLISVATRPEHVAPLLAARPEILAHGINEINELEPLLTAATVIVIGPGLGQKEFGHALFNQVMQARCPVVIDADGLNVLAQNQSIKPRENWVLTPHPGEAARLLDCSIQTIQQDRFKAIQQLRDKFGGVIVLKGAGTLIQGHSGYPYLCSAGNPGMASGGMGDVLSGMIGGLIAQGLAIDLSARMAVMLHACAADRAAKKGERGLLASDLFPYFRQLINHQHARTPS